MWCYSDQFNLKFSIHNLWGIFKGVDLQDKSPHKPTQIGTTLESLFEQLHILKETYISLKL